MQTKVFELHAVAFLVFFFTLQPEIGRALPFRYSFSGTLAERGYSVPRISTVICNIRVSSVYKSKLCI